MILMKDIVREGSALLTEKSSEVVLPFSEADQKILEDMSEYLRNSLNDETCTLYDLRPGVGIAAPQIGVLKKMIAINAYDEDGNFHEYALVNPKIKSHSQEKVYLPGGEGCLSIDREVEGYVHRFKRVTVETYIYKEVNGVKQLVFERIRFKNYLAIVFQHEYDHLNGILFVDRINSENPYEIVENSSPIIFVGSEDEDQQTD